MGKVSAAIKLADEAAMSFDEAVDAIKQHGSYDDALAALRPADEAASSADEAAGTLSKLKLAGYSGAGAGTLGLLAGANAVDNDGTNPDSGNGFNVEQFALTNPIKAVLGFIILLVVVRTATEQGTQSLISGGS